MLMNARATTLEPHGNEQRKFGKALGQAHGDDRNHAKTLTLGILASRINLQAHEYCCSFHHRVFQELSNPQETCVHLLLI